MKKVILLFWLLLLNLSYSQSDTTSVDLSQIEKKFNYQSGTIKLSSGNGSIIVPANFKFINAEQTRYILEDLWGNPADDTVLGSLIPSNKKITDDDAWLFTINYDNMGYVEDDDAKDTNYTDVLKDLQKEIAEANPERKKQGYPSITLVGWASEPYYDEQHKVIHWAKNLKFEGSDINTLNYDLRILGRKGVYLVSAVATTDQLAQVKSTIPSIISGVRFDKGYQYADFDSNVDDVAAWTVGGLVAGKVLAKVGFFALIAKFWKLIAIGAIAVFAAVKKFFFGKKHETSRPKTEESVTNNHTTDTTSDS